MRRVKPLELRKDFVVAMKSSNTNSFGLYQLILMSRDGEAYKIHASMYNAKDVGEFMSQTIKTNDKGIVVDEYFTGCELVSKLPRPPKDVLNEAFGGVNR